MAPHQRFKKQLRRLWFVVDMLSSLPLDEHVGRSSVEPDGRVSVGIGSFHPTEIAREGSFRLQTVKLKI